MDNHFCSLRGCLGSSSLPKRLPSQVERSCLGKKPRKVAMAAPLCLFWSAWKERNTLTFDNKGILPLRMKNLFVFSLHSWSTRFFSS